MTQSVCSECSLIVKLRSRSRSGKGQLRVRRVRFGPELYNIFNTAHQVLMFRCVRWNILHAFCNILERFACILEHLACILHEFLNIL